MTVGRSPGAGTLAVKGTPTCSRQLLPAVAAPRPCRCPPAGWPGWGCSRVSPHETSYGAAGERPPIALPIGNFPDPPGHSILVFRPAQNPAYAGSAQPMVELRPPERRDDLGVRGRFWGKTEPRPAITREPEVVDKSARSLSRSGD